MRVYQDFFTYQSGIYRHSRTAEIFESGYHSVRIIGWGEDYHRGALIKYWVSIARNIIPKRFTITNQRSYLIKHF